MTLRALRHGISFADMAVGMLFVAFALCAALMPAQNDTFWHLRAGADIWRTGQIPRIDNYSFTFAGAPWPDHEWLAQALMFAAFRVAGLPGLAIGGALLVLAAVAANRLLGAEFRFRPLFARLARKAATPAPSPDHPRLNLVLLAAVAATAAVVIGVMYRSGHPRLGWRPISDGALAATRACEGPLYNRYGDGGFLIWFTPEKPVFIDGRQDPFSMPFLLEAVALESDQVPYRPIFERWGIRCAFLPTDAKTGPLLAADGWITRFKDDKWHVLAAPASTAPRARP